MTTRLSSRISLLPYLQVDSVIFFFSSFSRCCVRAIDLDMCGWETISVGDSDCGDGNSDGGDGDGLYGDKFDGAADCGNCGSNSNSNGNITDRC